jgi:C4-dicarboxylate-specific signal transduction histidine kinase
MTKEENAQILKEKLEALLKALPSSITLSLLGACFITYVLVQTHNPFYVGLWMGCIVLISLPRLFLPYIYSKYSSHMSLEKWYLMYTSFVLIGTFSWGMFILFTLNTQNMGVNLMFSTTLLAVGIGGAFTNIASKRTAIGLFAIIISFLMFKTIIEKQDYYKTFLVLQVAFFMLCAHTISIFNKLYIGAIRNTMILKDQISLEQELQNAKLLTIQSSKLASLGEMTAGIAHEINNPLTITLGKVELMDKYLRRGIVDVEKLQAFLNDIREATARISDIIQSMKNLSRMKDQAEKQNFSIEELVDGVKPLIEKRLAQEKIQFIIEVGDYTICADKGEVSQVLLNLLNNSKDSAEDSQNPDRWIKIITEQKDSSLLLKVVDSGDGHKLIGNEKIFEPFFTTKDIGKGTGLGLSLSRNLMLRNDGKLFFEASGNTCFTMQFDNIFN